jgi:hypothetical protein
VYERLEPADLGRRHAWLFAYNPDVLSVTGDGWRAEQESAEREQQAAATEIADHLSDPDILRLADVVRLPAVLGGHLSPRLDDDRWERPVAAALDAGTSARRDLAAGLFWRRLRDRGREWASAFLTGRRGRWPVDHLVRLAVVFPHDGELWDLVEGWGDDARAAFWRLAPVGHLERPDTDAERAVRSLLAAGRADDALTVAVLYPDDPISTGTLLAVLDGLEREVTNGHRPPDGGALGESVGLLLDRLAAAGEVADDVLARYEWLWLPVLRDGRGTAVLDGLLARAPEFFAQVVGVMFRPENDVPDNSPTRSPGQATIRVPPQ